MIFLPLSWLSTPPPFFFFDVTYANISIHLSHQGFCCRPDTPYKNSLFKFWNNFLLGEEWHDGPKSKIQDSIGLSTIRIRAFLVSSAEYIESLYPPNLWFCFFFNFVQFFQKYFFSLPLQHVTFGMFGNFPWFYWYVRRFSLVLWFSWSVFVWALSFTFFPLRALP